MIKDGLHTHAQTEISQGACEGKLHVMAVIGKEMVYFNAWDLFHRLHKPFHHFTQGAGVVVLCNMWCFLSRFTPSKSRCRLSNSKQQHHFPKRLGLFTEHICLRKMRFKLRFKYSYNIYIIKYLKAYKYMHLRLWKPCQNHIECKMWIYFPHAYW